MESPVPVLAIVVAHDGAELLDDVLASLTAQTHEALDVIGVDNASTDGSGRILREHLGEECVLSTGTDLGFTGAVSMALDSGLAASSDATWILLVHDDLVLEPDAVAEMAAHVDRDPRLAVVGPKLRSLDHPRYLQQVGMSVDLTGRADSGVEDDELDQGQRDRVRPVLYVSTAGMFARREVFEELGRFDPRYGVFREDLDLCWRVWLAGHDVEVVPGAVGYHRRASADDHRVGDLGSLGRHYLAERNTLATLIKCYGAPRLLLVLPLFFIVGVAKTVGFLITRRVGDAWETLRAWGWNARTLRGTVRLRREVQRHRVRTDGDLRPLFIGPTTRARAYSEAIADRLVGDDFGVAEVTTWQEEERRGLRYWVRRRPGVAVAIGLAVLGLIASFPILGPGSLRGGDLATWPASSLDFFRVYGAGWTEATGTGSTIPASPAQVILGAVDLAVLGSSWLASRILLLGALPLAWLVALRAARPLTERRAPRLAAATLYVLSPPAVAAVTSGRIGAIAATILIPGLALAAVRAADPRSPAPTAWRATAVTALLAAVLVALEPPTALFILVAAAAGLVVVAGLDAPTRARRDAALRVVTAVLAGVVLLIPWSLTLFTAGTPVIGGFSDPGAAPAPFLRWLALAPGLDAFPGLVVGVALVAAGLLGLFLAAEARPIAVGSLWAVALTSVAAAWLLGRSGPAAAAWPGLPLLVAAGAYAGLLACAIDAARERLSAHGFGWRQVTAMVGVAVVATGGVAAAAHLVTDPWDTFVVDEPALPAFIGAESEVDRAYRVVTLVDRGDEVAWDVAASEGPTMLEYGVPRSRALTDHLEAAVDDVVAGASPEAAARLGHANVLYVYVPEGGRSEELEEALDGQIALEPQPVEHGRIYLVEDWLPRASYLPRAAWVALERGDRLPGDVEPSALTRVGEGRWRGEAPGRGALAVAEPDTAAWRAVVDGDPLEQLPGDGLVRYAIPQEGTVDVTYLGQPWRAAAIAVQALVALLVVSLALRPPRFARPEEA